MAQESVKATGLKNALQAFAASPRYALLRNLQVGRLLPEECDFNSPLSELTLESLVELGSARIVGSSALTLRQEATLIELLNSLTTEEEDVIIRDVPSEAPTVESPDTKDARPTIGSVQLELMLRQRIEAVCNHERYDSIRRRTLGEYWDPRWIPAPFEQALRLEQLAKMDLTVLFKKRSVDDNRIYLICCALERAYNSLSLPTIDAAVSVPSATPNLEGPSQLNAGAVSPWRLSDNRLSSAKKAIVELLALTAERKHDECIQGLLSTVMSEFSPDEFISIVCEDTVSPALLNRAHEVVERTVRLERRQLIGVLLQGPGVHSISVAHMLSASTDSQGAVIELLAVLVARGLGAQPVGYKGEVCEGFWTLNVDLVAHLIAEAQRAPKKAARTQNEEPQSPSLDPILLDWIRVQAGLRVAGKRCPRTKRK
jgi:hypothetical protein